MKDKGHETETRKDKKGRQRKKDQGKKMKEGR